MAKEMTADDIKLELDTGVTLYMDNIVAFTSSQVKYHDEFIDASPEKLKMIKKKKDNYELLKLNTSKNELRRLIEEESSSIIESVFIKKIGDELNMYKSQMDKFITDINESRDVLKKYYDKTTNNIELQNVIEKNIKKLSDVLENDRTIHNMRDSYQNATNKLNEALEDLKDVKEEFSKTNKSLQELFE